MVDSIVLVEDRKEWQTGCYEEQAGPVTCDLPSQMFWVPSHCVVCDRAPNIPGWQGYRVERQYKSRLFTGGGGWKHL
jgi:hypothetical protein